MSDGKTILVDVSRCTGCRGCQVACKQWNELPATDTVQTGSYQNPPDMNGDTYKIVRFREDHRRERNRKRDVSQRDTSFISPKFPSNAWH